MTKKNNIHAAIFLAFLIIGIYFLYSDDTQDTVEKAEAAFTAEAGSATNLPIDDTPTAWYDFSDSSTIYSDKACTTGDLSDGDRVGCVEDKSGNGNDIFNDPTYNLNGGNDDPESLITDNPAYKTNQNGSLSAIRFFSNPTTGNNNSAEYLYTGLGATRKNFAQPTTTDPTNNLGLDDGDHTIFIVIDPVSNAANYQDIIGNSETSVQTYGLRLNSSDKLEILRSVVGPVVKTSAADVDGSDTKTISTTSSSNDFDMRIDGVVDGTAASYAPAFGDASIGFGLSDKDTLQGYNGNINEIIIYPTALSLCDRQNIEKYLMDKWGQTFPGFTDGCTEYEFDPGPTEEEEEERGGTAHHTSSTIVAIGSNPLINNGNPITEPEDCSSLSPSVISNLNFTSGVDPCDDLWYENYCDENPDDPSCQEFLDKKEEEKNQGTPNFEYIEIVENGSSKDLSVNWKFNALKNDINEQISKNSSKPLLEIYISCDNPFVNIAIQGPNQTGEFSDVCDQNPSAIYSVPASKISEITSNKPKEIDGSLISHEGTFRILIDSPSEEAISTIGTLRDSSGMIIDHKVDAYGYFPN